MDERVQRIGSTRYPQIPLHGIQYFRVQHCDVIGIRRDRIALGNRCRVERGNGTRIASDVCIRVSHRRIERRNVCRVVCYSSVS